MTEVSLEQALRQTINGWFGNNVIDVHSTLDAMLATMASIAVKAGCNTDERVAILADHMKTNLAVQLNRERLLTTAVRDMPTQPTSQMPEKISAAARQARDTGLSVPVESEPGPGFK